MRRASWFLLALALLPGLASAKRAQQDLISVVAPTIQGGGSGHGLAPVAAAHPFVNLVIQFGTASNGTAADPSSFRARLGGTDVTALFRDVTVNGLPGKRAAIAPPVVRESTRPLNRLRLEVRSMPFDTAHGSRTVREIYRGRFAAVSTDNQSPHAFMSVSSDTVLAGVPIIFDGTQSTDPDEDVLKYHWDFGDGGTSTEVVPTHTFGSSGGDVPVTLTVDDGQGHAVAATTLLGVPTIEPGRTPGTLSIKADGPLEFGAVAPGSTGTRHITVTNTSADPVSQLRVRLGSEAADFTLDSRELDLSAGQQADVAITFAPSATGHRSSYFPITASTRESQSVHLLAHGFGGAATAGSADAFYGPTGSPAPAFFTSWTRAGIFALLSNGARREIASAVSTCDGGIGQEVCAVSNDCSTHGVTCSFASPFSFDPVDFCGDGHGGLFLIYEDSAVERNQNPVTERTNSLVRMDFDPNSGERTGLGVLMRANTSTQQLACSPAASQGGRVYLAEYNNIQNPQPPACGRDAREALTSVRMTNGNSQDVLDDINAATNYLPCDSFDNVTDLESTPDGLAAFANVSGETNQGGLYRIRPDPLLVSPDVDGYFQVHPDGSIVFVTTEDNGPTSVVRVYRISPAQAKQDGPVKLASQTPCATFAVQNNHLHTRVDDEMFAVGPSGAGSQDGVILVGFITRRGQDTPLSPLSPELTVQGVVAIDSPANSNNCSVRGVTSVEAPFQIRF